ncbi:MAG TPA: hypothetical protein VIK81_02035 [Patescibacteria group bacterium]
MDDQNSNAAPSGGTTGPAPTNQPAKKGYGKRPLWQWIVIYAVIGLIVYAVIYVAYAQLAGGGNGSTSLPY